GFTPDGTEIVTGSCSGALLVWDISDVSLPGHFIDSAQKIECCAFDVAVGDLDGDADLDLWIAGYRYQDSREDRVWLNGGEGIFRDSGQTLGGLSSRDVELGDLDGDGDLDAWVVSDGVSRVWSNNGAGVFTDGREQLQTNVTRVALGDVDGDGDLDAWLAISGGEFGLGAPNRVLLNDGTGKFTDSGQALGNSYSADVKLGDLDGDRDLDAFVANSGYTNPPDEPRRYLDRVWINDGTGRFTDSGQSLEGIPSFSYRVALGDLDGDGDLDAWVTQLTGSTIWLNNGAGNFSESPETVPTGENENIDLGDLDGDGDLDAWTGGWGSDQIWINDGNARFRDSGQVLGGYSRRGATALGDFDRDGDLDAWVSRSTFAKVWLNGEVPRIKIKKTGNQIIIDYIGTLERSETVNGQYGLVEGAYSPYSTEPIGPARFFRAR
ncbi:MAG: VCBS repeat-containing protein, partial [Pedosphaera parvula]|nr:VCBS repeat-containing protein [Pedosphaera parvula]